MSCFEKHPFMRICAIHCKHRETHSQENIKPFCCWCCCNCAIEETWYTTRETSFNNYFAMRHVLPLILHFLLVCVCLGSLNSFIFVDVVFCFFSLWSFHSSNLSAYVIFIYCMVCFVFLLSHLVRSIVVVVIIIDYSFCRCC